MSSRSDWIANRSTPCPVCGKKRRCKRHRERPGDLALCFRESAASVNGFRRIKSSGECSTYVRMGSPADKGRPAAARGRPTTTASNSTDLDARAKRHNETITDAQVDALASELGVSANSLRAIGVGYDGRNHTFPELDASGSVIGINRRYPNGTKRVGKGERRGLTIPNDLDELPGPRLIVEGASDAAALLTMKLAGVARPSASSGAELLAKLLDGKEAIVVGERDEKPDGKWPGCEGAIKIAERLARAWGKPVAWSLPPEGCKDVREYLNHDPTKIQRRLAGNSWCTCRRTN